MLFIYIFSICIYDNNRSKLYPNPTLKQIKNKPKSKNQGSTIKMKPGCNSSLTKQACKILSRTMTDNACCNER